MSFIRLGARVAHRKCLPKIAGSHQDEDAERNELYEFA